MYSRRNFISILASIPFWDKLPSSLSTKTWFLGKLVAVDWEFDNLDKLSLTLLV